MSNFRFEQLDIWKKAMEISDKLFNIADDLAERKKYRFSEQLSGASASIHK